ncbi:hypothetical protein PBV87_08755 [Niameybacter massiliensis]|uniref:Uncharacterized protein n=1 Tax=Holtiella tumoricola TaxID=3018743 RepID=A0AA42DMF1_9FIRM|nr:hypothetical protein [Holtiella tumoricola]MDA3731562.1 hypothetical protein [Holtiella tumoricola]
MLLVAWILTWFDVDIMMLEVIQPFMNIELTTSHYYILIAMIGLVGGAFSNSSK